ncbi:MAG TPA: peptidase U37, partial [Vicinamibacteria bacterium]|nr:peptidase U37 [Vicinamibacteria bacterium]
GGAISVDTLGAGRAAMRAQTGIDGATHLNVNPVYLIVPVAKETIADQYVTVITPQQGSNVNPFSGRLTVIAEPRLDDDSATAWYLAASPMQIDIIVLGTLEGEGGPMVESRVGFDVDGLEIKVRHDVAAKVVDFRGLYKNPGA